MVRIIVCEIEFNQHIVAVGFENLGGILNGISGAVEMVSLLSDSCSAQLT